jgi:hypothetical protein
MSSITLPDSALLSQDMLLAGIIETIITVDQMFQVIPFLEIEGNALAYNRELAMGDSDFFGVGDDITAKNPATFEQISSSLTKIIGDAEVDELIQTTRSNINNQKAVQIMSKAKSVARNYARNFILGDGTNNTFEGLMSLLATGQTIPADPDGSPLSFDLLDELLDKVVDKDGQVDYLLMHSRELRQYYALLRALGGATINDVVTLPSGAQVPAYRGTPIFRNDWIPTDLVQGTSTNASIVFAGTFDDGSQTTGLSGIAAMGNAGIRVQEVGVSETRDETITRVKWYCGLSLFSELGLAAVKGVIPA